MADRPGGLALARWLAWVVVGVGTLVLIGWITDQPILRSLLPRQVETKANTAVCLILVGVALGLKSAPAGRTRLRVANLCAAIATLTGLLTLAEYVAGPNLGIDELLFRDSATAAYTVHPGRMALPTALNFCLLGLAVLLLETGLDRMVAWLVAPAATLAALAFFGQLYSLPFLASFGPFTPIAAPTGITFLILSLGILLAGSGRMMTRVRSFGLMIGFVFALLLLLLMAGAVLRNTQVLIQNSRQVTQTYEVLDRLGATISVIQELETGARGYVLTGDPRFLDASLPASATVEQLLRELQDLTADNPAQQTKLNRLGPLVGQKLLGIRQQVERRQQGDAGAGKLQMAEIRSLMGELQHAERQLLQARQAGLEASTLRTLLTLGTGLAVSVALLVTIYLLLRREIAARHRFEVALGRSEENLAVTLNSIGDAVLATDTAGRVTRMNRVAEELTGWPRSEACGRPIGEVFRIIHEETRGDAPIPVDDVLATGERRESVNHTALIARDGTERAIADSAAPIRDPAGRILGVVLVFRDVTAERAARETLRLSEERYRSLFESIEQGFCIVELIFDREGLPADYRFLQVNPAFERQSGLKEAVGRRMREFAPDLEAEWFDTLGRVAVTGTAVRFQHRAEPLNRAYDIYAFRFGAPENRQVAILFSDITDRQQAQEELDRFFQLSLDFLCIASPDGTFRRASPGITDILGWTVEEFLARPCLDQVHPDDRAATQRVVDHQIQTGEKVLHFENRYQHKDGTWRVLSWRSVPHAGLMFATARDVTDARQQEAEIRRLHADLQQRAAQLEGANRELESFSYSVSHDLRAPLRHVQGYVEMLTREADAHLSDKARRFLKTIADSAREMGQLIDDLLAFSRMGRAEMREGTVDLAALVEEIRLWLGADAPTRDIRWTIAALPAVRGDAAMLRLVLVNLLGNAVKYTRPRAVAEITVGVAGTEADRTVLFVRDNGAGFEMKYADKLFGVFQRLHRADEFEGTGIGLANARRILNRHGGRIWAEARVGVGATFYFTLQPAPAGPSPTPTSP